MRPSKGDDFLGDRLAVKFKDGSLRREGGLASIQYITVIPALVAGTSLSAAGAGGAKCARTSLALHVQAQAGVPATRPALGPARPVPGGGNDG